MTSILYFYVADLSLLKSTKLKKNFPVFFAPRAQKSCCFWWWRRSFNRGLNVVWYFKLVQSLTTWTNFAKEPDINSHKSRLFYHLFKINFLRMVFVIKLILLWLCVSLFLFIDLNVTFMHLTHFKFSLYTATHVPDKGCFFLRGGEGRWRRSRSGNIAVMCHVSSGKEKRLPGLWSGILDCCPTYYNFFALLEIFLIIKYSPFMTML